MANSPLLAIETSGATARVALQEADGTVLAEAEQTAQRHSPGLLGLCHAVLTRAGVGVGDLAAIGCGEGPGSFTGLRIGLCTAKGLALPFDTPLVLVSSLQALATDLRRTMALTEGSVLACIDAGKGEIHAQMFSGSTAIATATGPARRLDPEGLCQWLTQTPIPGHLVLGGSGVDRFRETLQARLATVALAPQNCGPTAIAVAHLARRALTIGASASVADSAPQYGRAPDITRPRKPIPR